jgi:hypothetical protein
MPRHAYLRKRKHKVVQGLRALPQLLASQAMVHVL